LPVGVEVPTLTVRVDIPMPPAGTRTLVLVRDAVRPVGAVVVRATVPAKPLALVIVIEEFREDPCETVSWEGFGLIWKSWTSTVTCTMLVMVPLVAFTATL
jgi:hypothetical protein